MFFYFNSQKGWKQKIKDYQRKVLLVKTAKIKGYIKRFFFRETCLSVLVKRFCPIMLVKMAGRVLEWLLRVTENKGLIPEREPWEMAPTTKVGSRRVNCPLLILVISLRQRQSVATPPSHSRVVVFAMDVSYN